VNQTVLAQFIDQLPDSTHVICSNIDISQLPLLAANRMSGSSARVEPWYVTTIPNDGTKVGFVSALDTSLLPSYAAAAIASRSSMSLDLVMRLVINDMLTTHPDCAIVIMLSSLSSVPLALVIKQVLELDVVLSLTDSQADAGTTCMYSMYPYLSPPILHS
jgi:hypothetical protein